MRTWRICREAYAKDPLSGRGGLFTSGRWHTRGRRIVYSSATLSLAALELLVHADKDTLPVDLVQIEIDIPSDLALARVDLSELPKTWRSHPSPSAVQALGNHWLTAMSSAAVMVPSALIPSEWNILINPSHPEAGKILVVSATKFNYAPRLFS